MCYFSKLTGYHDRRMFFELARNSKWKTGDHREKKRDSPFPRSRCKEYRTVTRKRIGASLRLGFVLGFLDQSGRVARHFFLGPAALWYWFLICVACLIFFFSLWERGNGLLSALLLKNKYPAICSDYDDLQESGNTHSPIGEGGGPWGGGMITKAIWGGGGDTTGARQILE